MSEEVYLIVLLDIHDRHRYDQGYVPEVLQLINKHQGRLISAVDGPENLEGNLTNGRAVLICFPSDRALRAFYHDENYQHPKALRHEIAHSQAIVMPVGFHLKAPD